MARTKISEFSSTPGNNTDIDSINIAENCPPSGINDAIRELMAQLKDFQAGTAGDSFNGPVGTTTAAAGAFTTLSASGAVTLSGGTANGVAYLNGSKVLTTGSALTFDGTNFVAPASVISGGIASMYGNTFSVGNSQLWLMNNATASDTYRTSDTAQRYRMLTGVGFTWETAASGIAGAGISWSEQMRLTSTGLGIGTSSPGVRLQVEGAANSAPLTLLRLNNSGTTGGGPGIASRISFTAGATALGYIQGSNFASGAAGLQFSGDGTNAQATLDASGNLLVGTTSVTGPIVSGGSGVVLRAAGQIYANDSYFNVNADGTILQFRRSGTAVGSVSVTTTATTYNTSSDYRLKNTIAPMTGALAKVAQLKPVTYKWNADGSAGEGFIAHELAEVCPAAVTGEKDAVDAEGKPQYQGIDVSFLIGTLTAAIQEQQAIIEDMKTRLAAAGI